MLVTLFGIVTEAKLVHSWKAPSKVIVVLVISPASIVVTLFGMTKEANLVQPAKVPYLMVVTPSGIVIEVRLLHPLNAECPMSVTLLGRIIVCTL